MKKQTLSTCHPGPTEHVPAMEKVKQLVAEAGLEGRAFARSER